MRFRHFTSLLILLSSISAHSQGFTFPTRSDFSWDSVETTVPRARVDQFIKAMPNAFGYFRQKTTDYHSANLDTLAHRLHFLDITDDGRLDVIFDGESGGEPRLIEIFINQGNTYKKVFSDMQGIFKMEWRDKRLYKLYIEDWGCCAAYSDRKRIYQLTYDKTNLPSFVKMYQGISIKYAGIPDTLLDHPVRFEVLNDHYNIRSFPVVDDTSNQIWNSEGPDSIPHGNVIGKLPKGAKGIAIAKKTDTTGREWWYVEMDEEFFPLGMAFIKEDEEYPTKVIGWVSSRFVKVL